MQSFPGRRGGHDGQGRCRDLQIMEREGEFSQNVMQSSLYQAVLRSEIENRCRACPCARQRFCVDGLIAPFPGWWRAAEG